MKVMTILGTRPEIIRLSRVIPLLDAHAEHVLVHTGQNYDPRLSEVFFSELGVRPPDVYLGIRGTGFADQIGQILARTEALLLEHTPDRLLILGDTNSGLAAIIARRMGVPVYHMEAGNRCFDDRVPEEVNRRVIDHASSVLLPYTNRSRDNLLREGIDSREIYVTGNPIKQVIDHYASGIAASSVLATLGLQAKRYALATLHRAENVDDPGRLAALLRALGDVHREHGVPVVCALHPRTRARMESAGLSGEGIRCIDPLGFFDFVHLEQHAWCILSDSGTVQEEACLLGVPNVTLRDVTERPETVECGSNFLAGGEPADVARGVAWVTRQGGSWQVPAEYQTPDCANTVVRIVLAHRLPDRAEVAWQARVAALRTP